MKIFSFASICRTPATEACGADFHATGPLAPSRRRKKRTLPRGLAGQRWIPWIGWENGPDDRSFRVDKLVEKYLPDAYFKRPDKKIDKPGHDNWHLNLAKLLVKDGYKGPHLRIHSLTVTLCRRLGHPVATPRYMVRGKAAKKKSKPDDAFAQRAYRRPVTQAEIEPYVQLVLRQKVEPIVTLEGRDQKLKYRVYEGNGKVAQVRRA